MKLRFCLEGESPSQHLELLSCLGRKGKKIVKTKCHFMCHLKNYINDKIALKKFTQNNSKSTQYQLKIIAKCFSFINGEQSVAG